ncbi:hypothetical protein VitviT2T_029080 [Vitis vinifera]|uniref:ADP-ribosyl cyclase/cyclic ADP-ribose hydrolase n=1 Tax=Vitis vinifera TaxID=29760 RepID=A0ABY9DV35_VITVI|nr:hypothetical protein VitviT2T_029080 [Vitis vinifera]
MASTSGQKASSSPSSPHSYEVFISFRGEDTRKNFTDHLYTTLVAYGIHTFRDDEELEKGGDIASDLLRAIEESKIFIIIFSTNYANSRWCLNELVKIFECTTQKQSTILPIFYHVNPSDVRKQSGSYGDAFVDHEKDADEKKMEVIQKWRTALNQVASLCGLHVDEQYETLVVKEITDDIIRRLNRKPLNVGKNIVGMDFHLEKLKSLMNIELNEVRVVGIYGIGGIGKTTIAKAIYNDISYQFDGSSFLNNVRERSKDNALQLQQELLHGILKGKSPKVSNMDEGIQMIKRSLSSKRVLVVFDDVDDLMQIENLAEEHSWFGPRSRIIITTRHKHFLTQYGVKESYEVPILHDAEAIELFSWWAFKQNLPNEIYKNLSYQVVDYAKGLPLALEVLGSFLFKKTISEWESALCKLKTIPHMGIQNVLKISYDGLDDVEKGIFLDIACFFKGKDKDFVSRMLDEDFYAESGIGVLHDKCLISISGNKLDMHDLLQQMGWEIVRQECPKEPGRRSRLWEQEDIFDVLKRNMGSEKIEGIFLDLSHLEDILDFTTEAFAGMKKLRLLKVYNSKNLILRGNNFVTLPNMSGLSHLKTLVLGNCKRLEALPQLPSSIRSLNATDCTSLGTTESLKLLRPWELESLDSDVAFVIPGSRIPDWIRYQSSENVIEADLPLNWSTNCLGFALALVFSSQPPVSHWLWAEVFLDFGTCCCSIETQCFFHLEGDNCVLAHEVDHVLLNYVPVQPSLSPHQVIHIKATFAITSETGYEIKRCGLGLVYVNEEVNCNNVPPPNESTLVLKEISAGEPIECEDMTIECQDQRKPTLRYGIFL